MIDRIFITTVNRVNDQITLSQIPESLKGKVTLVVQKWERSQYNYDVDYMVLPEEVNIEDYHCLAKTRKIVYEEAKNLKYCLLDDDLLFKRRNQRRFCLPSNMEKSSRNCNEEDMLEMFNLYSDWLNEKEITFCGGCRFPIIPDTKEYSNNRPVFSQIFFDGPAFAEILGDIPLTEIRYNSDVLLLLSLFTRGYGSRESNVFGFDNISLKGKINQSQWKNEKGSFNKVWNDHKRLQEMFPNYYQIILNQDGSRVEGGFRNYGKVKVSWSKAYKNNNLDKFLY